MTNNKHLVNVNLADSVLYKIRLYVSRKMRTKGITREVTLLVVSAGLCSRQHCAGQTENSGCGRTYVESYVPGSFWPNASLNCSYIMGGKGALVMFIQYMITLWGIFKRNIFKKDSCLSIKTASKLLLSEWESIQCFQAIVSAD